METETYLTLPVRLKYVTEGEVGSALSTITEISKMITAIRSRLGEN